MKTCKRKHEREDKELYCKVCKIAARKLREVETKEERATYAKLYIKKNRTSLLEYKKEWRKLNKDYVASYQEANKERDSARKKNYEKQNKLKVNNRKKIYVKKRCETDLVFKLSRNLRTRLRKVLINKTKSGSAVRDLGCTGEQLKQHLELLFQPGMTWDNYGNKENQWSIDHIIPLSKVDLTNREELLKVCHYTNLQPMWHVDNLKKSNKY